MKIHYLPIIAMIVSSLAFATAEKSPMFHSEISSIPPTIATQMQNYTWHEGCPVPLEQLAYIQLSYWGFDNKTHTGKLIVNQELADEVVAIFKELYLHHFPIQSMELMDTFYGDDAASMAANNTSAFNCRGVTGRVGEYSQHSYGRAIDINPLINPYVNGNLVLPPEGAIYAGRTESIPGQIVKDDIVYQTFVKHGWDWAGDWFDLQDYQHFEKRAHGKKRNPYGYGF
ncbi:M15 family metallopeptidase [Legionella rowbothamii]|uniref:M15 family metallopeptidase n=1 Tax=Legionella rowbothamii TaxID=96229 RepID=UPI001055D2F2|nr:M15 family metallopeptidase [Legionella rowbothamii]